MSLDGVENAPQRSMISNKMKMIRIMIARSKAFGIWTAILLLMPVVIQCGRSDGRVMSEEELRVASSQHIDTTYITSMTAADSIAERDLWDAVSAEAWILVEDSWVCSSVPRISTSACTPPV